MQHPKTDWVKYIVVFFITVMLFGTATFFSNYFSNKKLEELKSIQDNVAIDILASETQFSLLEESSCQDISKETILSQELASLSDKISYSEKNLSSKSDEVIRLKQYYSLLEIKDFLLMNRLSERCNRPSIFILHFYDNEDCEPCVRQWYVLGELRAKYPELRVYSFDYNLDLSTIRTLIKIYKIPEEMPSLILNGKLYKGFQDMESIELALPALAKILEPEEGFEPTTSTLQKWRSTN